MQFRTSTHTTQNKAFSSLLLITIAASSQRIWPSERGSKTPLVDDTNATPLLELSKEVGVLNRSVRGLLKDLAMVVCVGQSDTVRRLDYFACWDTQKLIKYERKLDKVLQKKQLSTVWEYQVLRKLVEFLHAYRKYRSSYELNRDSLPTETSEFQSARVALAAVLTFPATCKVHEKDLNMKFAWPFDSTKPHNRDMHIVFNPNKLAAPLREIYDLFNRRELFTHAKFKVSPSGDTFKTAKKCFASVVASLNSNNFMEFADKLSCFGNLKLRELEDALWVLKVVCEKTSGDAHRIVDAVGMFIVWLYNFRRYLLEPIESDCKDPCQKSISKLWMVFQTLESGEVVGGSSEATLSMEEASQFSQGRGLSC